MSGAIIFDFDGVLGLSDAPRFKTLRDLCSKRNLALTDEYFPQMIGQTSEAALLQFFPNQDPAVLREIVADYRAEHKANIEKYVEPISTTVNFIRGYTGNRKLAVASMNTKDTIQRLISHFGIGTSFEVIVSRDEVTHHKPHPEAYLAAAKQLGVDPSACLVVEDTVLGATAALAAGMPCYILLNGVNSKNEFGDVAIAGFIENERDMEALGTRLLISHNHRT